MAVRTRTVIPWWRAHAHDRRRCVTRPLRYSFNVTLDGCVDHSAVVPGEEVHNHAADNIARADALLFGRVTYQMMEDGWREAAETGVLPEWMDDSWMPF